MEDEIKISSVKYVMLFQITEEIIFSKSIFVVRKYV